MTLTKSTGAAGAFASFLLLVTVLMAGCSSLAPGPGATGDASAPPHAEAPTSAPGVRPQPPPRNATPPAPQEIAVAAEGFYPVNPTFSPAELTVKSGANITLTFTNNDLNPMGKHDWFLDRAGVQTDLIDQGESTEITFVAPAPGDYAYYCAVDTHRERGMEGILHVVQ